MRREMVPCRELCIEDLIAMPEQSLHTGMQNWQSRMPHVAQDIQQLPSSQISHHDLVQQSVDLRKQCLSHTLHLFTSVLSK